MSNSVFWFHIVFFPNVPVVERYANYCVVSIPHTNTQGTWSLWSWLSLYCIRRLGIISNLLFSCHCWRAITALNNSSLTNEDRFTLLPQTWLISSNHIQRDSRYVTLHSIHMTTPEIFRCGISHTHIMVWSVTTSKWMYSHNHLASYAHLTRDMARLRH
jgi:hypothetical protein